MKSIRLLLCLTIILGLFVGVGFAGTTVPGHSKKADQDGNGIPDVGVWVNGHYYSVYAYDALGDWYWDLGDGRIYGTVGSINELDAATLSQCDYVVNYRAKFENDPYMDTGRIHNLINCYGYDGHAHFTYLIVHQDHPAYRGDGIPVWGTWEYHVLAESGSGNAVAKYRQEVRFANRQLP